MGRLHCQLYLNYFCKDEEMQEIRDSHPQLLEPQNIIGMQAQLWTELVRDVDAVHSQLFPRLIAFAERAWHKVGVNF